MRTRKFMQTLADDYFMEMSRIARRRGITLQQLLRAVVVPAWLRKERRAEPRTRPRPRKHKR